MDKYDWNALNVITMCYNIGLQIKGRALLQQPRPDTTMEVVMPINRTMSTDDRFWSKVEKTDTCWIWRGSLGSAGYGAFRRGHTRGAHRVAYEMAYGPIPTDMFVCHHCDVRSCVRPDHLFLGTTTDNIRDALSKGRLATGDRHGSRRHPERLVRGEQVHGSKLTADLVAIIRERYRAGGITQGDLAREYGIDSSNVSLIVRGKTWASNTNP